MLSEASVQFSPLRQQTLQRLTSRKTSGLDQKSARFHCLFAIEPDVKVAPDTINVRFRFPIRAGVFGVGMAECDMHTGNLFVLQNIADDSSTGCIRPDSEFAHAIAVFIGIGVSLEI